MANGTLALFIPILALSIPIIAIVSRHHRRLVEMRLAHGVSRDASPPAEAARRIEALEGRIAVLERIVTDSHTSIGPALAHEIEALRDSSREVRS